MKKTVAVVLAVMMVLALGVSAFAARGPLTLEEAKQVALDYAGVRASEATFTKAYRDWDDGREVYELEFYANDTEYDVDVDVNTGRVTDFSREYHGGYNMRPSNGYGRYYDDDMYEYGRYYDDDMYEYGRYYDDDMYDHDYDDWFDWD